MPGKPVCLVVGGGPGIGYSVARKWAANGYQVVITKRGPVAEDVLARDCAPGVLALQADVTDQERMTAVVKEIETRFGRISALIYNAGSGIFKKYEDLSVAELEKSFAINTSGLLIAAKLVCPSMVAAGSGVLAVTGATASLRGKPFTTGFAPAKAAQRMLAQSLARDLGPKNVHVFYNIIDGGVRPGAEDGGKHMDPEDIAETYWRVAQQKRSAWSFEVDLRPFCENW